jgi:hypothetical protein
MKDCTDCKYAEWHVTERGRLHPSGNGDCKVEIKTPVLPGSMYWLYKPEPLGGGINRHEELDDHCAYYTRKQS